MPQFRKPVIAPGTYTTPDGVVEVTPARIRHWHDSLQNMLAAGYRPPLSWGHVSKALPASPDDREFWKARWNAGSVIGSEVDRDGTLWLTGDAPGVQLENGKLVTEAELPDGRKVKSAIEEVSIGAADWTDGRGRLWKDAPIHLALTPLPVWVPEGGQPPFEITQPSGQHFSLVRCLYRFATSEEPTMAEETKEPPEKKEGDKEQEEMIPLKEVLADLADYGVVLPDDTTDENFKERLSVALKALKGRDGDEGEGEEEEVVEETPGSEGAFMSTIKDPVLRGLAAHMAGEMQRKRLERIDALVKRGLPPVKARGLRTEATTVRFAVNKDGSPARSALDDKLELLEGTLPDEWSVLSRGGQVVVETPPEGESPAARHKKVADEWAANTRLPARAGSK